MLTILLALFAFTIISAIGNAIILWGLARLLKVPQPRIKSAFVVAGIYPVISVIVVSSLYLTYEHSHLIASSLFLVGILASMILPLFAIRYLFAAKWGRSIAVYLSWGVCGSLFSLVITLGLRATALEAFVVPTSAMAPTIAGFHRLGTCPRCGEAMMVSTPLDQDGQPMTENKEGICVACWRFGKANELSSETSSGDRIITNKLLHPKRWDIVTYYPPDAPAVLYVHRIVGLPGESILVKSGQLWVDGVAQSPPPAWEKLVYAGMQEMEEQVGMSYGLEWGVDGKPCQLASDECFILGDNTLRSSDSCFFGPVKMDQITGVVTMRYWPPSRVGSLRH